MERLVKRFFGFVVIVMVLMILGEAIASKDYLVAIVFLPIIILFWLVSRFMVKKFGERL